MPNYNADLYKESRPTYPAELFEEIYKFHTQNPSASWDLAVDVGTGNGQSAQVLTNRFKSVIGFDPSQEMISKAEVSKVVYKVSKAEEFSSFVEPLSVDLVTVSTAAHWFDMPKFYAECSKVLKPSGTVAIYAYGHFISPMNPEITRLSLQFGMETMDPYWDPRRRFLDNMYSDPEFVNQSEFKIFERRLYTPLQSETNQNVVMYRKWSLKQIRAFYLTWSPYKTWLEIKGGQGLVDPIDVVIDEMKAAVGAVDENFELDIYWPIVLLLAKHQI